MASPMPEMAQDMGHQVEKVVLHINLHSHMNQHCQHKGLQSTGTQLSFELVQ